MGQPLGQSLVDPLKSQSHLVAHKSTVRCAHERTESRGLDRHQQTLAHGSTVHNNRENGNNPSCPLTAEQIRQWGLPTRRDLLGTATARGKP